MSFTIVTIEGGQQVRVPLEMMNDMIRDIESKKARAIDPKTTTWSQGLETKTQEQIRHYNPEHFVHCPREQTQEELFAMWQMTNMQMAMMRPRHSHRHLHHDMSASTVPTINSISERSRGSKRAEIPIDSFGDRERMLQSRVHYGTEQHSHRYASSEPLPRASSQNPQRNYFDAKQGSRNASYARGVSRDPHEFLGTDPHSNHFSARQPPPDFSREFANRCFVSKPQADAAIKSEDATVKKILELSAKAKKEGRLSDECLYDRNLQERLKYLGHKMFDEESKMAWKKNCAAIHMPTDLSIGLAKGKTFDQIFDYYPDLVVNGVKGNFLPHEPIV